MSRKSVNYKRGYEHADFADLFSELQGNGACTVVADETAVAAIDIPIEANPVFEESEERHRIMSDQKIKYLCSKYLNIIHDKHCPCAKEIRDEDLEWFEEYRSDLQPCPECMIQAYIAISAKDPKEIDQYCQFFEKAGMTDKQIRNIYVENRMKTRINPDAMTVWHKEDTWRIKILPKKGHVQLYHNNYIIRKKGYREFTQGFHIQNMQCADTNIGYAINTIKNYEYKPEESALHNQSITSVEKQKIKRRLLEKREGPALSLEEMLGERSKPLTVWQRIKEFFCSLFRKNNFFELNGFYIVSDQGYPENETICLYIWKDRNGQISWQTGVYNKKAEQFSVRYGTAIYAIKQDKVIAWKKMTADAMALPITDRGRIV